MGQFMPEDNHTSIHCWWKTCFHILASSLPCGTLQTRSSTPHPPLPHSPSPSSKQGQGHLSITSWLPSRQRVASLMAMMGAWGGGRWRVRHWTCLLWGCFLTVFLIYKIQKWNMTVKGMRLHCWRVLVEWNYVWVSWFQSIWQQINLPIWMQ